MVPSIKSPINKSVVASCSSTLEFKKMLSASLFFFLALSGLNVVHAENVSNSEPEVITATGVNPELLAFHKKNYSKPQLVKAGEGVHVAYSYAYSNFAFIETDNGTIAIDSGWYSSSAEQALKAYKKVSKKPIIAIIYTHIHADHISGAQIFKDDAQGDVSVIAPEDWQRYVQYRGSSVESIITRRGVSQMGIMLDENPKTGTVGAGIGLSPRADSPMTFVAPNKVISERTELNIDGVDLVLIPIEGDIKEHLMVWLPKQKTLFMGDILGGTFPYIATARFEPDRDPREFIKTIDKSLALEPEYVIGGHGRLLLSRDDVQDVLLNTRDIIQFFIDQLDRAVVHGLTADQVIDQLKIPAKLAKHPDLQPFYHRVEWIIRQMHIKRTGFFGREVDLVKLTESEQSKRLVALLGGPEAVLVEAQQAIEQGDYRWAASLATKVLDIDAESADAHALLNTAFAHIATGTTSANERNYLLTYLNASDKLNYVTKLASVRVLSKMSNKAILLQHLRAHLKAELAEGVNKFIDIVVDEDPVQQFQLRNNILVYLGESSDVTKNVEKQDAIKAVEKTGELTISLTRSALINAISGKSDWLTEYKNGEIKLTPNSEGESDVFLLFD